MAACLTIFLWRIVWDSVKFPALKVQSMQLLCFALFPNRYWLFFDKLWNGFSLEIPRKIYQAKRIELQIFHCLFLIPCEYFMIIQEMRDCVEVKVETEDEKEISGIKIPACCTALDFAMNLGRKICFNNENDEWRKEIHIWGQQRRQRNEMKCKFVLYKLQKFPLESQETRVESSLGWQ